MRARLLLALPLAANAAPPQAALIPVQAARIVARAPHDPGAFTEGLFYQGGAFYESTGEPGQSTIRKVDPTSGRVLRSVSIPAPTFGEGIVAIGRELVSLTWKDQTGYRWTLDGFKRIGSFHYSGEGWALTATPSDIVMSDGTAQLRFLDPKTLKERRRLTVTVDGQPVDQLNELECVDGEILANIWRTNRIARIDAASGHVIGWIDVSALSAEVHAADPDAVPNGIAWDKAHRRLFVTGKYWPTMFEIAPPKGR